MTEPNCTGACISSLFYLEERERRKKREEKKAPLCFRNKWASAACSQEHRVHLAVHFAMSPRAAGTSATCKAQEMGTAIGTESLSRALQLKAWIWARWAAVPGKRESEKPQSQKREQQHRDPCTAMELDSWLLIWCGAVPQHTASPVPGSRLLLCSALCLGTLMVSCSTCQFEEFFSTAVLCGKVSKYIHRSALKPESLPRNQQISCSVQIQAAHNLGFGIWDSSTGYLNVGC